MPTGTEMAKPTYRLALPVPHVKLITTEGWSADLCRPPGSPRTPVVYADMIDRPVWSTTDTGARVTMIDLDLDVIAWNDGTLMIDDEDEFAEHLRERHYPAATVALARSACRSVHTLLARDAEPFGRVADRWLAGVS